MKLRVKYSKMFELRFFPECSTDSDTALGEKIADFFGKLVLPSVAIAVYHFESIFGLYQGQNGLDRGRKGVKPH